MSLSLSERLEWLMQRLRDGEPVDKQVGDEFPILDELAFAVEQAKRHERNEYEFHKHQAWKLFENAWPAIYAAGYTGWLAGQCDDTCPKGEGIMADCLRAVVEAELEMSPEPQEKD